ncbi:MAG TPA: RNA polymerase-binding protein DksA [Steroidobacteraceae bacterium]|nr:RNA polymerase-binding protein DksA [Steroidobacteraceae bacterium]
MSRPTARKAAPRKSAERSERVKAAAHVRAKTPAATTRKPGAAPASRAPGVKHEPSAAHHKASETLGSTPPPAAPPASPATAVPAVRMAAPADGDDIDALEPGSLLAGPRNVQPYIVKRGEQYMGKEQTEHFRTILLSWKRDLMMEVDRTVTHMKDEAANFPDPNDRATQEEEFSLELRTRDRERKLIRKIDEALKRIEDGTYGYCLETGEEIGIKRLEARPVATLSIEAQERRERRERQYGDRDDRYR